MSWRDGVVVFYCLIKYRFFARLHHRQA